MIVIAVVLQLLILAGALYDTARLLGPDTGSHHVARARRRRTTLEAAERRLVERRLHGRIDAVAYRQAMHALAEGRRVAVRWHPLTEGRRALSRSHRLAEGRRGRG
ncbi:hypothetical protein [Streptomyces sp. NPDC001139]